MPSMFDEPAAGQWVLPIRRGYKIRCCDCGLVHIINFRVKKRRVEIQFFRDNRSTGQVRRKRRGSSAVARPVA